MESLERIVTYPMESDDWVKTIIIGGVLTFFGWLLVPLFLVYGYVVRAVREELEGTAEPPTFEAWGELLVDGLQAWLIGLVYMLIPLIVAAVTVGGAFVSVATGGNVGASVGGMLAGLALTTVLALVFGYLAVAGIVNFAREERFGAAFDVEVLRDVVFQRDYAVAWLVSVVIFFVAGFAAVVPFVGWILAPLASFYAMVVAANLWADGFSAALESSDVAGGVSGGETVA